MNWRRQSNLLKENEEESMSEDTEIKVKFDQIMGNNRHYTFGEHISNFKGGIYVKKGVPVPKRVVLVFADGEEAANDNPSS
jgi:hypothetical protein